MNATSHAGSDEPGRATEEYRMHDDDAAALTARDDARRD
jgi:hypothetical protein